jgi:hypothetical protein
MKLQGQKLGFVTIGARIGNYYKFTSEEFHILHTHSSPCATKGGLIEKSNLDGTYITREGNKQGTQSCVRVTAGYRTINIAHKLNL